MKSYQMEKYVCLSSKTSVQNMLPFEYYQEIST